MILDLAALLATAVLLAMLIALEVRHTGADTRPSTRPRILGRTVSRGAVAIMWAAYAVLVIPRVVGLLT